MSANPRLMDDMRAYVREQPGMADKVAMVWIDEERSNIPAECNLCNREITYGQFASGAAVMNDVGEMWHRGCEEPGAVFVEYLTMQGTVCPTCGSPCFGCQTSDMKVPKRRFLLCPNPDCAQKLVVPGERLRRPAPEATS